MRLRDYLADHIAAVGCLAAAELLLAGLLWLIGTPGVFIGFAAGIVALAAAAALVLFLFILVLDSNICAFSIKKALRLLHKIGIRRYIGQSFHRQLLRMLP